jgi:hypothetical protein
MSVRIGIIILLVSAGLYARPDTDRSNSISGVVVDQVTGEPVVAANVYISNTLLGSATDADGFYKIMAVPAGIHELVVTIVGYQFRSMMIVVRDDEDLEQNFSLKPLIYETESTEVLGELPKEWLANLELFRKYFLGNSKFARDCKIENPEVLEFSNPSSQILTADTEYPLIIDNHALGFTIRTVLLDFSVDRTLNRWEWSVKPAFTEMESSDTLEQALWRQNRLEAFSGSRDHFLISMIKHTLEEEGFTVYEVEYPGKRSSQRESLHSVLPYEEIIKNGSKKDEFILHFKSYLCVIHEYDKVSWIRLNYPEVIIDSEAIPMQINAFEVYGYWANYGMAAALPMYYPVKRR